MPIVSIAAALSLLGAEAAMPPAPPVPGTVAVALVGTDDGAAAGDDQPFADAVGQALGDASFTLLPGHSRYIAEVTVARRAAGIVATRVAKDPASAGIGSWGPTIRVPLGSKKTQLHDLVATTLTVRLYTRADHAPVWGGSAVTAGVDGAPVAAKLARAAVSAYPQTIATPVSVP